MSNGPVYAWHLPFTGISKNPNDAVSQTVPVNINDRIYFHFHLTGGMPNEMIFLRYQLFANGELLETSAFHNWTGSGENLWVSCIIRQFGTLSVRIFYVSQEGREVDLALQRITINENAANNTANNMAMNNVTNNETAPGGAAMNFADELNSIANIDPNQVKLAKLDETAKNIIYTVKSACSSKARERGHSISGFVDTDYDGTAIWVDAGGYPASYGSPAERRRAQKRTKTPFYKKFECLTLPKSKTAARHGIVHHLNSDEVAYIIKKIESSLTADGLTVSAQEVTFHDLKLHMYAAPYVIRESVTELPSTYPNILISVSW